MSWDGSRLSTVVDGSPEDSVEGEADLEVVAGSSLDGGRGLGVDSVLTSGSNVEPPVSGSSADSGVCGRDLEGGGGAVGVGGVGGPSVFQEGVLGVQLLAEECDEY